MLHMPWSVVITVLSNTDKHTKGKCIEDSSMFMATLVIFEYYVPWDGGAIICFDDLGGQTFSFLFQHLIVFHFKLVSEMKLIS